MIFLIALCPIFYTWGMTPKEHMKNMKLFGIYHIKFISDMIALEIKLKL